MTLEKMIYKELKIPGCFILYPKIYSDIRGSFHESYNKNIFDKILKKKFVFVQDNFSLSKKGVLRGLHLQMNKPQGKLISVLKGSIFDVFLDMRKNSPTFKTYETIKLNYSDKNLLWLPPGIAHGFCVTSKEVHLNYKVTNFYDPNSEYTIKWNDKNLNINWPITKPIVSKKDKDCSISLSKALKLFS